MMKTVMEVWIPGLNLFFTILFLCLLLSFCFDCEDVSNTRDSVSSRFQTPWVSSKILHYRIHYYFQQSSWWYGKPDKTLPWRQVFDDILIAVLCKCEMNTVMGNNIQVFGGGGVGGGVTTVKIIINSVGSTMHDNGHPKTSKPSPQKSLEIIKNCFYYLVLNKWDIKGLYFLLQYQYIAICK